MKKIILLALITLLMIGCETRTDAEIEEAERLNGFNTIIIDSCEYLIRSYEAGYYGYGWFAHKGNCQFCEERRQEKITKLITDLKDLNDTIK